MDLFHVILLAILQGVTELFPVSSLGHAVLFTRALHLNIDLKSPAFLPLLVALHIGTATALLLYFWKDWFEFLQPDSEHAIFHQPNRKVFISLIVATIPTAILGLLLEKKLSAIFSNPFWVGIFLLLNGFLLLAGEWVKRRNHLRPLSKLSPKQAFLIGLCQSLALLPGFSRSGATLVAGLFLGFSYEAAAHFSFLLATPIIFAAGVIEIPKLLKMDLQSVILPAVVGGIVAGIFAYLSTAFLMRYLKMRELYLLFPFGIYCIVVSILFLLMR